VWRIECAEGALHLDEGGVLIRRGNDNEERVRPLVDESGPSGRLLEGFVRAIETGEPAPTCARDNLNSLEMIWTAIEAAQAGSRLPVRRHTGP